MSVLESIEAYQTRARELRALTDDPTLLRLLSLLIDGLGRRANSEDIDEADLRMYLTHARLVLFQVERRLGLSIPGSPMRLSGD